MLAPALRTSRETLASQDRSCPFCCSQIPRDARKCRACAEWVVGTSGGVAAFALKLLALLWAAVTALAAAGLWTVGQGIVRWAWMHAVDTAITPHVVNLLVYGVIAVIVLKG